MPIPVPGSMEGVADGFQPLPAGMYLARVSDTEERETTGEGKTPKGTPYVAVELEVVDEEYEGRKVWQNVFFTEKSKPQLKNFLLGIGYTDDEINEMTEIDPEEWEGRECNVVVKVGKNPKTQEENNSVRRFMPVGAEISELPG